MGINNCIIIYDSRLKIPLISEDFINKLNKMNINCIFISDTANNIDLIKKYNEKDNIIITVGNNTIINNIYNMFIDEKQIALYSHIPLNFKNKNINDYSINMTEIENKINTLLQDTIETNLLKIDNMCFDSIIIGEDIFKFAKNPINFKDLIKYIKNFKTFKKIFSNGNKKDIIYLTSEECGNQFFYFGLISIYNNYNNVKIFNSNNNKFNILLIKELDNKKIYKLFTSILLKKQIDKELLEDCVVLNTDKVKLISNDNQKIYIDNEKSELLASSEIEIKFDDKIKILKSK